MKQKLSGIFSGLLLALAAVVFPAACYAQQGLPAKQVWAEQYNNWSITSQSANQFTFAGINCQSFPLVEGTTPPYFVFGNSNTSVFYPVFIQDANPSNSEIVTPTAISVVSGACGFSGSPANSHISFIVRSGTAGLQDAVGTLANANAAAINVMLDRTWYQLIAALPGAPSAGSIILNLKGGSAGVQIVDTTTSPWTYWNWNGSNYATNGGSTLPAVAYSTGAGTGPTKEAISGSGAAQTVSFVTGTSPTLSATIFTLTSPTAANGGFNHSPACTVKSIGANTPAVAPTVATSGSGPYVVTVTAGSTALAASTAYSLFVSCS